MKKNLYIIFLFLISAQITHAYTFTRTLSEGDQGKDVLELQKILNSNSDTAVSKSNNRGSYGNETDYFGPLTKDAVIRFQNVYKEEILYPNGLTYGTGFVGKSTLAFLNSFQNKDQKDNTDTSPTDKTSPVLFATSTVPTVQKTIPEFLISKTIAKADQTLYIGSNNILKDTSKFYLNGKEMSQKCKTEYTCSLHIDKDTKSGTYKLKSNIESWGSYDITVLSSSEKRPRVDVRTLYLTKSNVIKGEDFSEKMKVYTMFGVFETETKNNSFVLEFPKEYVRNATTTTPGFFYLENSNGLTSNPRRINYEI